MNRDGWIKLHRSALENDVFKNDPTAWRTFEILLLLADRKGQLTIGSKQLSDHLGMHPTTAWRALKRLFTQSMVQLSAQRSFTRVTICKWNEYQGDTQRQSQRLTQSSRNHYKNKNTNPKGFVRGRKFSEENSSALDGPVPPWVESPF